MTEHRHRPPHPKTKGAKRGHCRWCHKPFYRKDGVTLDMRRTFHPECRAEHSLYQYDDVQYNYLFEKQGGKCAKCGCPPPVRKGPEVARAVMDGYDPRTGQGGYLVKHTSVTFTFDKDHTIPLWSVRHLPDDQRYWYYTVENQTLLCPSCHLEKTSRESGERAKWARQTKPKEKPRSGSIPSRGFQKGQKTQWPKGRKIQSRGFPKKA